MTTVEKPRVPDSAARISSVAPRRFRSGSARTSRRLARLAFALVIILSPFRLAIVLAAHPIPPLYSGYTDALLTAGDAAVLATLALWVLSLVGDPRRVDLGPRFITWPLLGLVVVAWVSTITSIDPTISIENAVDLVFLAGLTLYVRNEVDSVGSLFVPVAIAVGVQAVVGLAQVVLQRSVGLDALGELRLDPTAAGISVVATSAADRLLRAYGLTDHPNILAGALAFSLPLLALGLGTTDRRRTILASAAFVLGGLGLVATFSRSGWLAAAVGFAIGLAIMVRGRLWHQARAWLLVGGVTFLLGAILLVPYERFLAVRANVLDPVVPTEVMSTGERVELVGAVGRLAVAHPLTGTGLATLPISIMRTQPGLTFDSQPAPFVLLDVAAEIGLLGALCYGWLLVAPWVAMWRRRAATPELAAVSAALAAVTVIGFFDYYTWTFASGRIWAWLLLGLWAGAYVRADASSMTAVPMRSARAGRPTLGIEADA